MESTVLASGLSSMKEIAQLTLIIGWTVVSHGAPVPLQKISTNYSLSAVTGPASLRDEARTEKWAGEQAPVDGMKVFARESGGSVWLGSQHGAARFNSHAKHRWDRWQYFSGRRWLMDDDVRNIVVEERRGATVVWIRTATGISVIEWRPMTLEEKAKYFDERIEARHVRHGLVSDSGLRVAGDLSSNVKSDNDNDGLWTAMYLGAQAYRYAVTKDPDARMKAQRAVRAMLRLEEITGVPGFYARSFVSMDEPRPGGGEWHPTPDGKWLWKGDTSSDESVGHYFGYAAYYDLVADEKEKEQIRQVISRMTDYVIAHDYDLIDLDGKPTRWGQWSEAYFKTVEGTYEAPLRSLELLSFLKTTEHITGDRKYRDAYEDRVRAGYAKQVPSYRRWAGGGEINFSDDELAYLSWQPLMKYERDRELRKIYLDGLRFTWSQVRPDMNPLWNYISAASGAGKMTREVREESRQALERVPMDMIEWSVRNSHRRGLKFRVDRERFGRVQTVEVLAPDERAVSKWNGNPYVPDGGANGFGEDDGAFFLLPYWYGRYHGWVK
jgi:hypothetical protein